MLFVLLNIYFINTVNSYSIRYSFSFHHKKMKGEIDASLIHACTISDFYRTNPTFKSNDFDHMWIKLFQENFIFLFFLFSDSNVAGDSRRHWFSASFFTTAYNDCIRRQTHCIWRWTLHVKWLSIVDIRFTSEYRSDLIILVIK